MPRRAVPAIVLVPLLIVAIVVSTSACGTIANFNGGATLLRPPDKTPLPPVPYGGVKFDIKTAVEKDIMSPDAVPVWPLWIVEVGLSATMDTVTLPAVFWVNLRLAWERAIAEQSGPSRVKVLDIQPVHNPD